MNNRKLVVYIATSLDGYIATKDDNLDFLNLVEQEGEDYGYAEFIKTIDTVIMGRKTYDKIVSMDIGFPPHTNKECYILTHGERPTEGNLHFYNHDIPALVRDLKSREGKNIFCDGGAEIIHLLLKNKLVDEITVSIIPFLLGDGIRLFKGDEPEQNLKLTSAKSFEKGLVQLHYELAH